MTCQTKSHLSAEKTGRRGLLKIFGAGAMAATATTVAGTAVAATQTRRVENFGVPWEESYGYAQAILDGDMIYLSGQLSHDAEGNLVAPAPLDDDGRVKDFDNMGAQIEQTYANCKEMLSRFGATLDNAIEEVVYVLDMDAAFAAIPDLRRQAWGKAPVVTSTILVTPRLALPPQLCEIKMTARL
jgi:enamine deaminase RidA (YjgF/YER057c/UK114 family)